MRKEVPEVGRGDFEILGTRDAAVLAIQYEWRNNSALFVHNLASAPREISLTVKAATEDARLLIILSEDHSHADGEGKHRLVLEGYGYRWYRVGGLDYLLRRSDIDGTRPAKAR